ncbi:MAG: hypothetical protein RLZZ546_1698, partial [Bacteroidota bacterium]
IVRSNKVYYALKSSNNEIGDNFNFVDGYFREEGDKVYKLIDTSEILVYDFNLKVGDVFDNGDLKAKVIMVENQILPVLFSYRTTRVLTLECLNSPSGSTFKWYQGMGSLIDGPDCKFDINTELNCFFINDIRIYPRTQSSTVLDCWVVATNDLVFSEFQIIPNPINDVLKIKSEIDINSFEIWDISGRLIDEVKNINEYDVHLLSQGVYFIKVKFQNGKVGYSKWVKG